MPAAFEHLMQDLASPLFDVSPADTVKHGRNGQAQNGVDLYIASHEIGIQCKLTTKSLPYEVVEDEVEKAITFTPALKRFVIATSAPSDATLQSKMAAPNASFSVSFLFWDDINNILNRSYLCSTRNLREVITEKSAHELEVEHLESLRNAIDRPAFKRPVDHEFSFMEQKEAERSVTAFIRTGRLVDSGARLVEEKLPLHHYDSEYEKRLDDFVKKLDTMYLRFDKVLKNGGANDELDLESARINVLRAFNAVVRRWWKDWPDDDPPIAELNQYGGNDR